MNLLLLIAGTWIILDGVGSMIRYYWQPLPDQLVRAMRIGVGVQVFLAAFP